ncbi:hypothetical protein OUZ56_027113 [Daphnia magna]|uniref:Uncharacterized protein n=1 Tax=Daphnia magna TaxID=35525 RepID=A0ABQ9ZNS9_9CRUS|nr:hypothetical protein OUZ56_027113 [Daphnia magna]
MPFSGAEYIALPAYGRILIRQLVPFIRLKLFPLSENKTLIQRLRNLLHEKKNRPRQKTQLAKNKNKSTTERWGRGKECTPLLCQGENKNNKLNIAVAFIAASLTRVVRYIPHYFFFYKHYNQQRGIIELYEHLDPNRKIKHAAVSTLASTHLWIPKKKWLLPRYRDLMDCIIRTAAIDA